jgi:hypothetical protein
MRTSRNRSSRNLDLQFRILQLILIREDSVLKIAELIAHRRKQRPGKLLLQLFDQLTLERVEEVAAADTEDR